MDLNPPKIPAPEFTFVIPERARHFKTDPKNVTLRAFGVGQEMDALKASGIGSKRFDYELIDRCAIVVDDKPWDQSESLIERCSPKVRALLVRGLNKASLPEDDEISDFLESMEVKMPAA